MDEVKYFLLKVGERVRILPHSEWFMRGAKYGTITSKRMGVIKVKLEGIGPKRLRPKFSATELESVDLT